MQTSAKAEIRLHQLQGLKPRKNKGFYLVFKCKGSKVRTPIFQDGQTCFNETLHLDYHTGEHIAVEAWAKDLVFDDSIGVGFIAAKEIEAGRGIWSGIVSFVHDNEPAGSARISIAV